MARRTLGDAGATAVSLTYALLHYTLLVACESRCRRPSCRHSLADEAQLHV
jgi:hypothetical protein